MRLISKEEFEKEVLNSDKLCIVDFFATWCEPCRMLAPVLESVAANEKYQDKIEFYKLDIDGNEQLSVTYGVEVVPTLKFFKNGQVIGEEVGYKTVSELESAIDKII